LCFFSVVYKHINGTGEITHYLAQTGLPEYVSNMYMYMFLSLREYCSCLVIEKHTHTHTK